jgi:hypothetical protein
MKLSISYSNGYLWLNRRVSDSVTRSIGVRLRKGA